VTLIRCRRAGAKPGRENLWHYLRQPLTGSNRLYPTWEGPQAGRHCGWRACASCRTGQDGVRRYALRCDSVGSVLIGSRISTLREAELPASAVVLLVWEELFSGPGCAMSWGDK